MKNPIAPVIQKKVKQVGTVVATLYFVLGLVAVPCYIAAHTAIVLTLMLSLVCDLLLLFFIYKCIRILLTTNTIKGSLLCKK